VSDSAPSPNPSEADGDGADGSTRGRARSPIFRAGQTYHITTRSVRFTRATFKPSLYGDDEEIELSGQELAIYIDAGLPSRSPTGEAWCFMAAELRADNVTINAANGNRPGADVVHFTLQELVEHFEIPEVPDVAAADPARFENFLQQLRQLERI
jgi:hypothetical protein